MLLNSLRWLIYVINSIDNTKPPYHTLSPTQHHSFFSNLPLLCINLGQTSFPPTNRLINKLTASNVHKYRMRPSYQLLCFTTSKTFKSNIQITFFQRSTNKAKVTKINRKGHVGYKALKLRDKNAFNPLTPASDQGRTSPYYIYTISYRKVVRIKKNIKYEITN